MRTSARFVARTNIEYFKIYSVSTTDMDRGEEKGEDLSQCLNFFGQGEGEGGHFFMILCRRRLWMDPEQKKYSKVKHGL